MKSHITLAKNCFASIHRLGGWWVAAFFQDYYKQRKKREECAFGLTITVMPTRGDT